MTEKLSIFERAQRYVAQMPPAIEGSGGSTACMAVAKVLLDGFALSHDDALAILREYSERCSPPWKEHELLHKLRSVKTTGTGSLLRQGDSYTPRHASGSVAPVAARAEEPKPEYDPAKLKRFAAGWVNQVSASWLADRSEIDPSACSTGEFLAALYYPDRGEKVIVFLNEFSQGEAIWPDDKELPSQGPRGVWYLAQPVDGVWRKNPRGKNPEKLSRRIAECVLSWRYLVLESDEADARDWLAAVVQLPLKIAAIYTSGSRSIHVLVRVDAANAADWDRQKASLLKGLVTLGADRGALSGVRLTRLPNCLRLGKDVASAPAEGVSENTQPMKKTYQPFPKPRLQKLLYLCREPAARPICGMIPRRDLRSSLETLVKSQGPSLLSGSSDDLRRLQGRLLHVASESPVCKAAAREIGELLEEMA